jgi:hypothetical protein
VEVRGILASLGMNTPRIMKSVTTTYPKFHALPKGVKQMLLVSESFFFDEARPLPDTRDPVSGFKFHDKEVKTHYQLSTLN